MSCLGNELVPGYSNDKDILGYFQNIRKNARGDSRASALGAWNPPKRNISNNQYGGHHRQVNGGVIRWSAWAYCRRVIASVAGRRPGLPEGLAGGNVIWRGGNAIGRSGH